MADDNCRYLTVDEERDALDILLQDARADLTAARARIAELEGWQRRAADALRAYDEDGKYSRKLVLRLLKEAN